MREAEKADRERMEDQPMETMDKAHARMERDAAAVRMYKSGMSAPEVAINLGVSEATIYAILKRENVERHPPRKKETPKMTDEKITVQPDEEIRQLKEQLEKQITLTDAAVALMMAWKERYELAERTRHINAELNAKEAAYFEALRAAKPAKEA
jgi:transposase